jgi:hypothetical protein
MQNKIWCLEKAIEITKEFSKSQGTRAAEETLQAVYDKLKELYPDSRS